jgi:xylulokinase
MGIDSSTQSCKVVVRDSESGELIRHGRAAHPEGTEVEPHFWESALHSAIAQAGGLEDVAALSVGGQQHGLVCLDEAGEVVRPALLWNDIRSARAATELVAERGAAFWATAVGSVPVASFTITKLRWLAEHEPENAKRVAAVCLPHDWLTWRLSGSEDLADLRTDRSDASGTGYWSPAAGEYRLDLLQAAFGRLVTLPEVLGPTQAAGRNRQGVLLGPGAGDNAAAALGVTARAGDVVVSLGTSGVVSAVSPVPAADPSGLVAGFASATGDFLPLACTLNGARVLDAVGGLLDVDHEAFAGLALSAAPGAGGLSFIPYLEGERTPNLPDAQGALHGITLANTTAANLARAAVEGLLCGLADAVQALSAQGVDAQRYLLIGGAAASPAVRAIAPSILGAPVTVPEAGEYVADGAARQAAWVLSGAPEPPAWPLAGAEICRAPAAPQVHERYAEVRELTRR